MANDQEHKIVLWNQPRRLNGRPATAEVVCLCNGEVLRCDKVYYVTCDAAWAFETEVQDG